MQIQVKFFLAKNWYENRKLSRKQNLQGTRPGAKISEARGNSIKKKTKLKGFMRRRDARRLRRSRARARDKKGLRRWSYLQCHKRKKHDINLSNSKKGVPGYLLRRSCS